MCCYNYEVGYALEIAHILFYTIIVVDLKPEGIRKTVDTKQCLH